MYIEGLRCTSCGSLFSDQERIWACRKCGSLLDVTYNYEEIEKKIDKDTFKGREANLWRYRELLPITEIGNVVSLGEGGTPLLRSERYGKDLELKRLFLKFEYLNPTGSYKDRGATTLISKARELQIEHLVDDTSGNAGSAAAAYCAKAGLKCTIFTPASAPIGKLAQVRMYGATLRRIPGTRRDVTDAIHRYVEENEVYYGSHNMNPFFLEGCKTFAYELVKDMGWESPDHLVLPVGGGILMLGAYKGFLELRQLGWIDGAPKLHCVQSAACMPIVNAYEKGLDYVEDVEEGETVAGGVRIVKPVRGEQILKAIKETQGSAVSVSDEEVLHHQRTLAEREGIFVEPTTSVALAGLTKLHLNRVIDLDEKVVIPLTGFGLKDVKTAERQITF